MWEVVSSTIASEFADLGHTDEITRLVIRILVAVLLAAAVGYEREMRGSSAGLRTHMMVGLGVSVLVVASQASGMEPDAVSRVIQGIFAGLGFLGAGAILKMRDEEHVRGLTTAATLWATAGIATAAGLGKQGTAIVATVFAYVILAILFKLEKRKPGTSDRSRFAG